MSTVTCTQCDSSVDSLVNIIVHLGHVLLCKKNNFPNNYVYMDTSQIWLLDGTFDKCRKSAIKINVLPQ
jgi:diphthamide synthase subunit DPH2